MLFDFISDFLMLGIFSPFFHLGSQTQCLCVRDPRQEKKKKQSNKSLFFISGQQRTQIDKRGVTDGDSIKNSSDLGLSMDIFFIKKKTRAEERMSHHHPYASDLEKNFVPVLGCNWTVYRC